MTMMAPAANSAESLMIWA